LFHIANADGIVPPNETRSGTGWRRFCDGWTSDFASSARLAIHSPLAPCAFWAFRPDASPVEEGVLRAQGLVRPIILDAAGCTRSATEPWRWPKNAMIDIKRAWRPVRQVRGNADRTYNVEWVHRLFSTTNDSCLLTTAGRPATIFNPSRQQAQFGPCVSWRLDADAVDGDSRPGSSRKRGRWLCAGNVLPRILIAHAQGADRFLPMITAGKSRCY